MGGVTFDTHFTFSPHITNLADRAQNRIRILKALAGSTWGQQQETLLITYKALIRPLFTYAAPIWFPNAPPSGVLKLQRIQNSALSPPTSCSAILRPPLSGLVWSGLVWSGLV